MPACSAVLWGWSLFVVLIHWQSFRWTISVARDFVATVLLTEICYEGQPTLGGAPAGAPERAPAILYYSDSAGPISGDLALLVQLWPTLSETMRKDLAFVIQRWPTLPEETRTQIKALVTPPRE